MLLIPHLQATYEMALSQHMPSSAVAFCVQLTTKPSYKSATGSTSQGRSRTYVYSRSLGKC
jgi:hypothetical protein